MMPTASMVSPTAPRRMTRDEVLRLGQTSRPWDFLPIGLAACRAAPGDAAVRFLLAATFGKLGLKTAALEQLAVFAELGGRMQMAQQHAALAAALAALPEDRIPSQVPREHCRFNLEVLAARGIELGPEHDRWELAQAGCEWFAASDGNVVRRRGEVWLGLGEHRLSAARFVGGHVDPARPQPAYFVEGIDPPWLALELARGTPGTSSGFRPTLCIVQADAQEFLDGLAFAELPVLREERVRVFVGRDASERMGAFLRGRTAYALSGPLVPLASTRRRAEPSVESVLVAVRGDQQFEAQSLAGEIATRAAGRDREWWLRRYTHALMPQSCQPLRVLIPTTRHSTYLQHSSRDLAAAFAAAGYQARLLIEEDDHAQWSSVGYLRALREFDPDLVVLINCTRAHLGEWFPPVPYICWFQDALRHQFDARLGSKQGPLDFMVGHLHSELFSHFGFPRERTLSMPVVTSEAKFHDGAVSPGLRERFACDVAFVSHHSETPEAMHARMVLEAGGDRDVTRTLERLRPEVERIARDPMGGHQHLRLDEAVRSVISAGAGEADGRIVTHLVRQYALPLAERILRHETLEWATEVCARRGWRLKVFGKGWEKHPTLAAFAGGLVEHGEELRACYQCAGVHLHVSATALIHQRIMECALSGGLPLCRLTASAVDAVHGAVRRAVGIKAPPAQRNAATGEHGYIVADHPELLAHTALLQRLGAPTSDVYWQPQVDVEKARANPVLPEHRPDWVLVDMAETTFADRARLEARIERALSSPEWRAGMGRAMAGRVRERLTHGAFVKRVLGLVQQELQRGTR